MPHRIIKTIAGRRGSALTLAGSTFVPLAILHLTQTTEFRSAAIERVGVYVPWLTSEAIGWLLLGIASAALLVGAFSRLLPAWFLGVGYSFAFLPPAFLALFYVVALILEPWPGGFISFWVYASLASLVFLIAGWDEPRRSRPMSDEQLSIFTGEVK